MRVRAAGGERAVTRKCVKWGVLEGDTICGVALREVLSFSAFCQRLSQRFEAVMCALWRIIGAIESVCFAR